MAALSSSTCTSLAASKSTTSPHKITFPSNSKTHLAFPLSPSKRLLTFPLNAEKKDTFPNEPNRKKRSKDRKRITIGENYYTEKSLQMSRKTIEDHVEELRLLIKTDKKCAQELDKAEKFLKASENLDLVKLIDCFEDDDTFSVTKVERYISGGIFYGNLRVPVDQALPVLEKKLSETAEKEVHVFFLGEENQKMKAAMVLPKAQTDLRYEVDQLSTTTVYALTAALSISSLGTIALMSGFFLKPDATIDYYLADVLPLFGGFLTILGVSEIATRVTAARYGVKLSPSLYVPSVWTGCLGVITWYESILPSKKALFDIPFARIATSYLTSLSLIVAAFLSDGSLNGGDNPLYIKPDFFFNSPLLSLIQFINGDYLIPYEVEGVGVTVDPLAFAGLLGMIMTSLNLLPCGGGDGRYIFESMFGKSSSNVRAATPLIILGYGAINGSVLLVAWGVATILLYQGRLQHDPKDSITPLGQGRYILGVILALTGFLTFFPNAAGTFSTCSLTQPSLGVLCETL